MEALEEITPEQVKSLSLEEAKVLYEERLSIVSRMRVEMDLLKEKIWPPAKIEKCELCGSTNLRFLANGGYFCRKCGYRRGQAVAQEI
jgi:ribosomal protein L37AE/L43A